MHREVRKPSPLTSCPPTALDPRIVIELAMPVDLDHMCRLHCMIQFPFQRSSYSLCLAHACASTMRCLEDACEIRGLSIVIAGAPEEKGGV